MIVELREVVSNSHQGSPQGSIGRSDDRTIGVVCLGAAFMLVVLMRLKPIHETHVHEMKVDLSGDVSLENLTCKQCGGNLSEKSVSVRAGAVFVQCEFCGAEYQLEEAPKW